MNTKNEHVSEEIIEAMGISRMVYEEIQQIVGALPTVEQLSTLLAMWEGNGKQQSLLSWLKGQPHAIEATDYLARETDIKDRNLKEPKVKDCISIAKSLFKNQQINEPKAGTSISETGEEIYLVGNIITSFLDSEYGRKYLHIVDCPIEMDSMEDNLGYYQMITDALKENEILRSICLVERGGIFGTLLEMTGPLGFGFDILTCREIRLDAFLFGEEKGRLIVTLPESKDDFFLQKMDEAGVNCCFLGRITKGRILIDGMDFGPSSEYSKGR